jgi:hypothetical protein
VVVPVLGAVDELGGHGVVGDVCGVEGVSVGIDPPPPPVPPPAKPLGVSAWAEVIETACTTGTVQSAAAPTMAPRLSRSRRARPDAGASTSWTDAVVTYIPR